MSRFWLYWLLLVLLVDRPVWAEEPEPKFAPDALEFFEKKVRPVLVTRCFECHANDKAKGGLRLDSRQASLEGGETGPAVVPGKAKDSLLISAINYGDVYQMPPKSKMPANEIEVLTKWVELGAPWPPEARKVTRTEAAMDIEARKAQHWCWKAPAAQAAPTVKNTAWPTGDIDRFILAKLEGKGLEPAAPADKRTLIRRAYVALIGLPPTPAEVAAFVADDSPQAFEKVIDRLLDSVHFGERWARHWLDLVRYAETRGHEFEPIIPNAYQYRDYVIRALNADVPYNQFVTEHLAGDLMSTPRLNPAGFNESLLGTGFWFLGEEVHSPVDIRQDETDRIDNRLDVFSKSFLALTLSCARCHDHKFDAMTQQDYYGLAGFALGASYRQVAFEVHDHNRRVAEQLDVLRKQSRDAVVKAVLAQRQPVVDRLASYLTTAAELAQSGLKWDGAARDVVFADFEGNSYSGWTATGEAFGTQPPKKGDNEYNAPLEGFAGQRFVNSHRNGPADRNNAGVRDSYVGKLTSPRFRVAHDRIQFLIAGGSHAGQTCINLVIGGKVVRTATGQNSGQLKPVEWNVADLRDQEALIEIVDDHRGGWGHVIVDHIEFKNGGGPDIRTSAERLDAQSRAAVQRAAEAKQLDAKLLARWTLTLIEAQSGSRPALLSPLLEAPAAGASSTTSLVDRLKLPAEKVIADFTQPQTAWLQDGVTFGLRPTQRGEVRFGTTTAQPIVGLHDSSAAIRDPLMPEVFAKGDRDHGTLGAWERSGRTLRTIETTLKEPRLWYLVCGSGRAYATVNSHLVIAGPLHGALLMEWQGKPDEWRWVSHNLAAYKGNRLHVEFSPRGNEDCGVALVVQSDAAPTDPGLNALAATTLDPAAFRSAESTQRLQSQLQAAVKALAAGAAMDSAQVRLMNWFLQQDALFSVGTSASAEIEQFVAAQERLLKSFKTESQAAPAMLEGNGVDEFVLVRGNSKTPGKAVPHRFLSAITGTDANYGPGSGRLKLAQQIVDPSNPLTSRVAVNRLWHHLFGRGLVPTVDNFGTLGEKPTHPELLDHLAVQFMQGGWSQKKLIKSVMLSRTYQMASTVGGRGDEVDPDNQLLHRMPIRRLEGEAIRDIVLAISGRLDRQAFGPSVPIHLTPFMEGRGRPGVNGPLDGAGRRSIYIAVRRNFLSPMMLAFDTPQPFSTVGRRTVSNVPAQALILMNDPLMLEQSKLWAQRVLSEPNLSDSERIQQMYETAFARPATEAELQAAVGFLNAQAERLGVARESAKRSVEVWTDLCHVLFNVKEFIFVN